MSGGEGEIHIQDANNLFSTQDLMRKGKLFVLDLCARLMYGVSHMEGIYDTERICREVS